MDAIWKLSLLALMPITVSIVLYLLEKKTKLSKLKNRYKQLIYGVVFGMLAILGTEFGVNVNGAILNTRDAAALISGLVFGAPAGLIAGFMGGIERFFAVYWGAGQETRLACSISTIMAGFVGAVLRKFMFDDKKPSPLYALGIGLVVEVFHMLMIFFTKMNDISGAFDYVETASLPMISVNGVAVMLSVLIITILGKEKVVKNQGTKSISTQFQRWLLLTVLAAFFLTSGFTTILQINISEKNQTDLLQLNIQDVMSDISDGSNKNILQKAHNTINILNGTYSLDEIVNMENLSEINIVDRNGIIIQSTVPEYVGFDMDGENSTEQSMEFMKKIFIENLDSWVQEFQPISFNSNVYMKYAAVKIDEDKFVQVGYSAERFSKELDEIVAGMAKNRHIGQTGYLIIANKDYVIISDKNKNEGKKLSDIGIEISDQQNNVKSMGLVSNEICYHMYDVSDSYYYIVSVYPQKEAVVLRRLSIYVTVFMEVVVFVGLFILVYFLLKKLVVSNVKKINSSLAEITGGNLNVVVDVRSNEEFASLSEDINCTVSTLKRYIAEAAARIDKELEFAKAIQHSSLPSVFPPYPERKDFDIYASMYTAKEVGGDFYDFYFVGPDKLAFLIADVSGKGIPAAMFMMTAKTVIKGYAESGRDVSETLTLTNKKLCENNDANMFVTAWLGFIDLSTGDVEYANAGHNPPLVRHNNGEFEYLKSSPGFVLAGMETVKYRKNNFKLGRGDTIFIYTDGVTEATDKNTKLYGDERLLNLLNSMGNISCEEICKNVKNDIDKFVGEAPQFDDITMLCFKLKEDSMKELTIDATIENIEKVTNFTNQLLEKYNCPIKAQTQIDIAIDELFGNIAHYAYNPEVGPATVRVEVIDNPLSVVITFIDGGVQYDPLAKDDPDLTKSAQEREIGGLGIFMVKKTMDEITYEYKDGKNILRIRKEI